MVLDKEYISMTYIRHQLALQGIKTLETQKSLGFGLLTNSMQNLAIISAVMTNHKTKKGNKEYNYNFWEFKIPENKTNFLICVCFEFIEDKIKVNGTFIFPKEIIDKIGKNNTINIFESDISGIYNREPKINKHKYFNNYNLIKKEKEE